MNVRYRLELSQAERNELTGDARRRQARRPQLKRAQILLGGRWRLSRQGDCPDVSVSLSTVGRTKRRFVEGNLERALSEEPRPALSAS